MVGAYQALKFLTSPHLVACARFLTTQDLQTWDAIQQELRGLAADQPILFGSQYQRGCVDASEGVRTVCLLDRPEFD
jgi:hypothetical protein